jgi:hypothetical protein
MGQVCGATPTPTGLPLAAALDSASTSLAVFYLFSGAWVRSPNPGFQVI